MPLKLSWIRSLSLFSVAFLLSAGSVFAQSAGCPAVAAHEATPAEEAYQKGKYEVAESLTCRDFSENPTIWN
jgi:hypothetical protein